MGIQGVKIKPQSPAEMHCERGRCPKTSAFRVGIQFFINLLKNMKVLSGKLLRVLPASQYSRWLNEKWQCHTQWYIVHSVTQWREQGIIRLFWKHNLQSVEPRAYCLSPTVCRDKAWTVRVNFNSCDSSNLKGVGMTVLYCICIYREEKWVFDSVLFGAARF